MFKVKKKEKKKLQASIIDLQDVFVFISVTQIRVITLQCRANINIVHCNVLLIVEQSKQCNQYNLPVMTTYHVTTKYRQ